MTDPSNFPATQLYTDVATGELRERQFRFSIVQGPDKGVDRLLESGTTMVGTHPNNDLVLTDDTVSRYHLELQVRRDGLQVKDLGSTNGTFHGDTRVTAITVQGATRLRVGRHTGVEIVPNEASVELAEFVDDRLGRVLGVSPVMRNLFALLQRVSPTDATLLLEGETGTGKEAIAEAVHGLSARSGNTLTVVDCAAIPSNLIGSELFGHVKGAFTGAHSDKDGLIQAASGGTLFLDEIGELAIELQPQLLRVLEKREVRRIGDTRSTRVDIRVVAATNRNLKEMVKLGTFREDLYYRLAVVRAVVPPLRERPDDIPLLAHHFADQMGASFDLSPSLVDDLRNHAWPGNVRELRNVVERALSLGREGLAPPRVSELVTSGNPALSGGGSAHAAPTYGVTAGSTPDEVYDLPFKEAKGRLIEGFERDYLTHLLRRHRGNISRAAAEAGIDRNYIHRLVKKYNLPVDRG
ncbi:MAG TPA: sigma 54-interacting transcriptional regulator [Kofleriaceae bacterium]|nr:sigma 54-interacting transcriptional regulator [Kofleriaceae bacterium]